MIKHEHFDGDTLVEVMFAIGLFSVIVVGTVSIMNSGTSKVQNSLEITMTRNEIDAEAEALRYIQSSYIAERDLSTDSQTYSALWDDIKALAINDSYITDADFDSIINYNPSTCSELYADDGQVSKYGFILNYHKLDQSGLSEYKNGTNNILFTGKNNRNIFKETKTYPRVLFNGKDDIYAGTNLYSELTNAEGIYIIAVKDTGITTSVDENGTGKISAFMDFYIRSCWQASGSDTPTLTSTVIRLYNPDIDVVDYSKATLGLIYDPDGGTPTPTPQIYEGKESSHNFAITSIVPKRNGAEAIGWAEQSQTEDVCNSLYTRGKTISVSARNPNVTLKAIYQCPYIARFYNGGEKIGELKAEAGKTYSFDLNGVGRPTKSSYTFLGWAENRNASAPDCYVSQGNCRSPQLSAPSKTTVNLYAIWRQNYVINYNANGGSYAPAATTCTSESSPKNCKITNQVPSRSGYKFQGWATSASSTNVSYVPDSNVPMSASNPNITLYAVWKEQNETITVKLTWGYSPSDLDSHVYGQKSDGKYFHAYYGSKVGSDISGLIIAKLDQDITNGRGPETFIINTLGGRNYYYYVDNFSDHSSITNATVEVSSASLGTITYQASNASGSGRYWNVFAYKDGRIIGRGTRTTVEETSY